MQVVMQNRKDFMLNLQEAIHKLKQDSLSCIAFREDFEYVSTLRGIKPLLQPLSQDPNYFRDAMLVDRVIGKSAAFLVIKGHIKSLHALTISQHALDLLDKHKIPVTYDQLVPYIINNAKTGMCPMEESVLNTEDVEEAFMILTEKVKAMAQANKNIS